MADVAFGIAIVGVGMLSLGNRCFAVAANRAIVILSGVAGAGTGVSASVVAGYVVLIGELMRRYAVVDAAKIAEVVAFVGVGMLEHRAIYRSLVADITANAAVFVLNLVSVAISGGLHHPFVSMSDGSREVASLAVASRVASIVPKVVESEHVAGAGFGRAADGANSVFNLILRAGCVSKRFPSAEGVLPILDGVAANGAKRAIASRRLVTGAHTGCAAFVTIKVFIVVKHMRSLAGEVASGNVTDNVAGFVVIDVAGCLYVAHLRFFVSADAADVDFNLISSAGSGNLGFPFAEGVRSSSSFVASCTVAGGIAIVGVAMSQSGLSLGEVLRSANGADSYENLCIVTVGGLLGGPAAKGMRILSLLAATVAADVAIVVVKVVRNNSHGAANIAVLIAGMIVNVGLSDSLLAANVTVCIAACGINVVGNHSKLTANIASGVAGVGINVCVGDSVCIADVASLVAGVGVVVRRHSLLAAEVAIGVAIVGVDMLRGDSLLAASITVGVAGAIIDVSRRCIARLAAELAVNVATGFVFVRAAFAGNLAADITGCVIAVGEFMLRFRLACHAVAGVAGGIAGAGVIVILTEAASQGEKHQRQRDRAK